MINTKDLEEVIALTLATAYVEGETPQSSMLISKQPEAGKTTLVNMFRRTDGIAIISDCTAKGLLESYKSRLLDGTLKHIIIPEFLAPISRNKSTVSSFLATVQILIEDGFQKIDTGFMHQDYTEPRTIGVIACLPQAAFYDNRTKWSASGLLSRFLVVSYDYMDATIGTIFESIMDRQYLGKAEISLKFGDKLDIKLPLPVAKLCKELALSTLQKSQYSKGMYGFRQLESVQRMVMASVVLDKANGVERDNVAMPDDFYRVEKISYLFNDEFNKLKTYKDGE